METMNVCLRILTENKKVVNESFQLKHIPKFTSAIELENYIVSEKVKAAKLESLEIGYYGPRRGTRYAIIDDWCVFHREATVGSDMGMEPTRWSGQQMSKSKFHGSGQQQSQKIVPIK